MAAAKPLVPVIVGPTAIGKTEIALALAAHWPLTVISADSRQVYRRLDVGTAKPSPAVLAECPHVGIDVVDPGERYSAGRFAADGAKWLAKLSENRRPVVVGGTGFYVRALADGLFREPPIDAARRARFRAWAADAPRLGVWASRLDPGFVGGGGRQRAARTVEVALLTGQPLTHWQHEARISGAMRPWYVRLTLPRPVLQERIAGRTARMLSEGWIEEVRRLITDGIDPQAAGLDGVGYREIVAFLEGDLARDDLESTIVTNTRRYAKRQATWFRHQLIGHPVVTLDATDPAESLARRIVDLWEARGG